MSDTLAVLDKNEALKAVSGNEKLAEDLLAMFIKELPGYKLGIEKAFKSQNLDELRNIIHKIHGGLRYLGAPALLDVIALTDQELFNLPEEELNYNINKIYQEIDRLLLEEKYDKTYDYVKYQELT